MAKKVKISAHIIDDYQEGSTTEGQPTPTINNITREDLYTWYNKISELRGIVTTVCSDVFGEGFELDGSEARIKKTNTFLVNNHFHSKCKAVFRDSMITGDGYMGIAAITEGQVLAAMDEVWKDTFQKSASARDKKKMLAKVSQVKPDIYSPQVLFPLMSRSMKINYNENGEVESYSEQPKSTGEAILFAPEEVMHFPYEPYGDSIYGTSPFQTAIYDIAALSAAKNYGGYFFQNDATPSHIYQLTDESPDSPNYKRFCEVLKQHRAAPHKSMVITGGVEIHKLNGLNKDLEFSEFIEKRIQSILMSVGITARYSHLFSGRLEASANLEGYYKLINSIQKDWEEVLNQQLFSHFDVEFNYKRVYKRDDSRETDIVTKLVGNLITRDEGRAYLGYKPLRKEQLAEIEQIQKEKLPAKVQPDKKDDVMSGDARTAQNEEQQTGPFRPKDERGTA